MQVRNAAKKQKPRTKDQTNPALRRALGFVLLFVSTALLANAVIGERGLIATRAAEREAKALAAEIALIQEENDLLRERAKGLRDDPKAIEEAARDGLGLMRDGELLIILQDGPGVSEPSSPVSSPWLSR